METKTVEGFFVLEVPLKPSFEGWKLTGMDRYSMLDGPLKPSFEGWKLEDQGKLNTAHLVFETFL